MVEVLRRNHDAMMLKYETYRQRNEELEADVFEKKKTYSQIKSANDSLQAEVYDHRRTATDLSQKVEILDSKLRNAEQGKKESTEAATSLRTGKTQLEGQLKVMNE
jgi:chromosome segregation ATPase